jgi:hypothetical protein
MAARSRITREWHHDFAVEILLGKRCYAVEARTAINALAEQSLEAANWWRTNVPWVLVPGRLFVSWADVCEEVD